MFLIPSQMYYTSRAHPAGPIISYGFSFQFVCRCSCHRLVRMCNYIMTMVTGNLVPRLYRVEAPERDKAWERGYLVIGTCDNHTIDYGMHNRSHIISGRHVCTQTVPVRFVNLCCYIATLKQPCNALNKQGLEKSFLFSNQLRFIAIPCTPTQPFLVL